MNSQNRQNQADGGTEWLEVFEIRSPISEPDSLRSKLETLKRNLLAGETSESIQFYCHSELTTDWCIHLRYTCDSSGRVGSSLGLRILPSLEELGSVYHSVWQELRSCDAPDKRKSP